MSEVTTTLPIVEAAPDAKLEAFAAPNAPDCVAGVRFHPFAAMRKALLQITGNEILSADEHIRRYCVAGNKPLPGDDNFGEYLVNAVPDAAYHMTALAYICVADAADLARVSRNREAFAAAVYQFWDGLTEAQWQAVTAQAFAELAGAETGNDFKVKETKDGAPASKN